MGGTRRRISDGPQSDLFDRLIEYPTPAETMADKIDMAHFLSSDAPGRSATTRQVRPITARPMIVARRTTFSIYRSWSAWSFSR
jgi:hypothetical protein